MIRNNKHCGCDTQIIWYFTNPTIFVCEKCEIVMPHYTYIECPYCGGEVTEFIKNPTP